jgi:hypothetical protein
MQGRSQTWNQDEANFVWFGMRAARRGNLDMRLGGLGERRELPQRGSGRSPDRKRIWCIETRNLYWNLNYKHQIMCISLKVKVPV